MWDGVQRKMRWPWHLCQEDTGGQLGKAMKASTAMWKDRATKEIGLGSEDPSTSHVPSKGHSEKAVSQLYSAGVLPCQPQGLVPGHSEQD